MFGYDRDFKKYQPSLECLFVIVMHKFFSLKFNKIIFSNLLKSNNPNKFMGYQTNQILNQKI